MQIQTPIQSLPHNGIKEKTQEKHLEVMEY